MSVLLMGVTWASAQTAHVYVKTAATPEAPYGSWANAFNDLQDALDYVITSAPTGANLYLAGETFEAGPRSEAPTDTVFLLQSVSNVVIRGGYEAASGSGDNPGNNDPDAYPTVLRLSSGEGRVLTLVGVSNAVIEQVAIRDGQGVDGGGVYLDACSDVVFSGVEVVENVALKNGGALYLAASSVLITNSLVSGNHADESGVRATRYGGGVYVDGDSHLLVRRSLFTDNHVYGRNPGGGQGHGYGGGVYVASDGVADVREVVIVGNSANHAGTIYQGYGGAIMNHGTLHLQNALVVSNQSSTSHSDGILADGDATLLLNCTIADNYEIGVYYLSGAMAVTNSIVWGHATDLRDFNQIGETLPDVWFSAIGDGQNHGEQGCTTQDPLFVDRAYYHLQSTEGYYADAYFEGGVFGYGTWLNAASNSPLIDRGDPDSDFSREPPPNGDWINMGAYGNTEVASKTEPVEFPLPVITNKGATAWGRTTVVLNAEVTHVGVDVPETSFAYWQDGGSATSTVSGGLQSGLFSVSIAGLEPSTTYHFVALATNSAGYHRSDEESFTTRQPMSALYVATNGNNTAGTNWSTAYPDLRTAMQIMGSGDMMYLAEHVFADEPLFGETEVFRLQGVTNIFISGGYSAVDDNNLPGSRGNEAFSVLERTIGEANTWSLLDVTECLVENVTVRYGNGSNGGGVYLSGSSNIIFKACRITNNIARLDGGGLYLANSSVAMTNCIISANHADESVRATRYGGGVYVDAGSHFTAHGSMFDNNLVAGRVPGSGQGHGFGGALYVAPGGTAQINEGVMIHNTAIGTSGSLPYDGHGGAIANAGSVHLRQVLMAHNVANTLIGDGFWSGSPQSVSHLNNVTIADNNTANPANIGVWYGDGTLSISNSIVWGHDTDLMNFPVDGSGHLLNVGYTLFDGIPTMHGINGCIVGEDPLFEDTVYYHLQSEQGVYQDGYFDGGTWGESAAVSPAIDAGDPDADWSGEPAPQGRRLNMGAYGGTSVASMTPTIRGSLFMFR